MEEVVEDVVEDVVVVVDDVVVVVEEVVVVVEDVVVVVDDVVDTVVEVTVEVVVSRVNVSVSVELDESVSVVLLEAVDPNTDVPVTDHDENEYPFIGIAYNEYVPDA